MMTRQESRTVMRKVVTGTLLAGLSSLPVVAIAETQCASSERENTAIEPTTPTMDFMLHDDGTATHLKTGLMWQRCTVGTTWNSAEENCASVEVGTGNGDDDEDDEDFMFRWSGALNYVQNLNDQGGAAGYTDWRLPSLNEYESITELRCWDPAVNTEVFPGIVYQENNDNYWTSTPYARNPTDTSSVWNMHFGQGGPNYSTRFARNYLLLVRDAD